MTTFEQYFNLYLVVCGSVVNVAAVVIAAVWWITSDD